MEKIINVVLNDNFIILAGDKLNTVKIGPFPYKLLYLYTDKYIIDQLLGQPLNSNYLLHNNKFYFNEKLITGYYTLKNFTISKSGEITIIPEESRKEIIVGVKKLISNHFAIEAFGSKGNNRLIEFYDLPGDLPIDLFPNWEEIIVNGKFYMNSFLMLSLGKKFLLIRDDSKNRIIGDVVYNKSVNNLLAPVKIYSTAPCKCNCVLKLPMPKIPEGYKIDFLDDLEKVIFSKRFIFNQKFELINDKDQNVFLVGTMPEGKINLLIGNIVKKYPKIVNVVRSLNELTFLLDDEDEVNISLGEDYGSYYELVPLNDIYSDAILFSKPYINSWTHTSLEHGSTKKYLSVNLSGLDNPALFEIVKISCN